MKMCLLGLWLACMATASFAQTTLSAPDLCQKIAAVNSSNGLACSELISLHAFDEASLSIANKAFNKSSSTAALDYLKLTNGHTMEIQAGKACEMIMDFNQQNAVMCVRALLNAYPAPELLILAKKLLTVGSTYSVKVLQDGVHAYFFGPLMEICQDMVTINGTNTLACVQTIMNKVSTNGTEAICKKTLNQSSAETIKCLKGIVIENPPMMVLETRRKRNQRGLIENAQRTLEETSRITE